MALVGDLRDVKIEDILRFIKRLSKSGKLVINGKEHKGEIYFAKGMIIGAKKESQEVSKDNLKEVVFMLLKQNEGNFSLEPTDGPEKKIDFIDPDDIVMEL